MHIAIPLRSGRPIERHPRSLQLAPRKHSDIDEPIGHGLAPLAVFQRCIYLRACRGEVDTLRTHHQGRRHQHSYLLRYPRSSVIFGTAARSARV